MCVSNWGLQGQPPASLLLDFALARAATLADSGGPALGFVADQQLDALVASNTCWRNLVVALVSATSSSSSFFFPTASRSAPARRKLETVLCRKRLCTAQNGGLPAPRSPLSRRGNSWLNGMEV